jgi:murein DD-endopeptidase MepM/ murein hydrolase activator NlpD
MSLIFPINVPITSDFGAETGTDVGASGDGVVIWEGTNKDFGNTVIIEHESGTLTLYAHLDKTDVQSGDVVSQGDTIGQVGNTGRSTGSHLHFETIDANQEWRGAKLNNHIKWANKQEPDKNGYKKIGIPGGVGRYNLKEEFTPQKYYIWFTQMDDRVRSSHMARHGQTFSWNASPIPGEEENCRCWALQKRALLTQNRKTLILSINSV